MSRCHRLLPAATLTATLAACSVAPRHAPAPAPPVPDISAIPDAVPRQEPRSERGNPPFYDVLGQRYFVLASARDYVERGVASWYGPGFHAASTSSGERYDMYAMSAAHKTLPLPSYARVTNLRNGRSIVVRINDRGPFVANRLIDLSYTAAAKLDMVGDGTALVEVRTLEPGGSAAAAGVAARAAAPTPVATGPAAALYVQAGAFADERNAQRLAERLRAAGFTGAFVRVYEDATRRLLHRVRIGPVASVGDFDLLVARLAAFGLADVRLALD
ncbi:MAG: septal ring lytic transglycosylase RlpA family protein [Gammaproteobacteria bacterium]|nr:septal ring lytic transglycosylase RlpA family protein [Gammaproteobacteria bacterium]